MFKKILGAVMIIIIFGPQIALGLGEEVVTEVGCKVVCDEWLEKDESLPKGYDPLALKSTEVFLKTYVENKDKPKIERVLKSYGQMIKYNLKQVFCDPKNTETGKPLFIKK